MTHVDSGGGASRSTDPAAGSSAATDVSLREFLGSQLSAMDRHLTAELAALRRETDTANKVAAEAVEVAKHEANESLKSHNGLIEQMRQQAEVYQRVQAEQAAKYASREALEDFKQERHLALDVFKDEADKRFGRIERFQAMLIGGMLLISFIGIANLVKVWGG